MNKSLSPRALASKIILDVIKNGRSLNSAFTENLDANKTKNQGFIKELCYGTLRWYEQLIAIQQQLVKKPLKTSDQDIEILILLGFYQLVHLKTKSHAAIYETAQAARELKKIWAVGLINGVLREFQRQQENILNKIQTIASAKYAHPNWLIDLLKKSWPQTWQTIIEANNSHPPLTLRINRLQKSREQYLTLLNEKGIVAYSTIHSEMGITLLQAQDITQLPGFIEGEFSVQDEAAQLAANLLELAPGQNVLDACAAPGGKTAHILETQTNLNYLLAIDNDAKRLAKIADNLNRLKLNNKVQLLHADAAQPESWNKNQLFDRILLDAPCSATGVIRRHPDIKLLRRSEDIEALKQQQLKLLNALWPLLKVNGILVYATCSVLPQENIEVLQQFLAQHADAQVKIIQAEWGIPVKIGRQIFPQHGKMDGFYYAKLIRTSS